MVDFRLQNITQINRTGDRRQYIPGKKETSQPAAGPSGVSDVVQISNDAAMKGRISAFAATLAKEMNHSVNPERIAQLKKQYAGDNCPVSGAAIAGAIIARISAEGSANE